ncbi:MAG: 4Fe-4S binding protein [bacterium]|nr:4Fe-4S binding protein [bacterium]
MEKPRHSIRFVEEKCVGCGTCMRACPTKAIRVVHGKARVNDERCIDCGECFRLCPHDAIVSETTSYADLEKFECAIALPSPVLYSQFAPDVLPNQILLALKKIGFEYVADEAWDCELTTNALQEYLDTSEGPFPKISNTCPVVVRLIAMLYPNLVKNLVKLEIPRESAAKKFRQKASKSREIPPEKIGVLHITPCPAKMISINHPVGLEKSNLDGAIPISDIYGRLLEALKNLEEDIVLQLSSGIGIAWAISSGEIMGIRQENCLAVSGVHDVIRVLNDVEAGRLNDIVFLECLICPDGCIGGSLTVQNRHQARRKVRRLVKMFGEHTRVSREMALRLYRGGYFNLQAEILPNPLPPLDSDPGKAIQKLKQRDKILMTLPGKNCSACGAPDCRTLAEDVVLGQASIDDCVFLTLEKLKRTA